MKGIQWAIDTFGERDNRRRKEIKRKQIKSCHVHREAAPYMNTAEVDSLFGSVWSKLINDTAKRYCTDTCHSQRCVRQSDAFCSSALQSRQGQLID